VAPSGPSDPQWHREGYRRYWRRRSGGPGRPRIPRNHISLIRRISSDNPGWGEDRIALDLKAKLGVEHAPSTIRRYMVTVTREGDGRPVSSTWRTFLAGHANELWTMDLTWLKQRIREATPFGSGPPFMGSLRRECLDHFVFLSEDHLRRTVVVYIAYYIQVVPAFSLP